MTSTIFWRAGAPGRASGARRMGWGRDNRQMPSISDCFGPLVEWGFVDDHYILSEQTV